MKSIAAFALLLLVTPASALTAPFFQPRLGDCYSYEQIVKTLGSLGEVGTSPALVDLTHTSVEVFISKEGSLTVVEVFANNIGCYRAFNDDAMHMGIGWNTSIKLFGHPL